MNEKVEELVEWVANGISVSVCSKCAGVGEVCDNCRLPQGYEYETAKAILSHPDLVLIDRSRIKKHIDDTGQPYWDYPKYIPLAEALKEIDNGQD